MKKMKLYAEAKSITVREGFENFVNAKMALNRSPETIKYYHTRFPVFMDFIETQQKKTLASELTDNDVNKYIVYRRNLCAEYLNRPPELVITTLMHEMAHLFNIQRNVQDTSRAGTYHNRQFKEVAEARGLIVEKDPKYGYCVTKPSAEFTELVKKNCRAGCFKLERLKTYRDGTPKVTTTGSDGREKTVTRTKQSSRKYVCPQCGMTVRATKEVNVKCGDCDVSMQIED